MNEKLIRLILDFQESVQEALKLMQRSGIKMPHNRNDWFKSDFSMIKELENGVKYRKHGAGCWVNLDTGAVDFDFGEKGEIGGFNTWWLVLFAGKRLINYGFKDQKEVAESLSKALDSKKLIATDHDLYYIANVPYIYAIDIDSRLPGDMLPSRNQDRILTLQSHYFLSAELMLKNYDKLIEKLNKTNRLSQSKKIDMRIYFTTWLGFLAVVCEGFRKLNIHILLTNDRPDSFKELLPISDNIGRLMKEHADPLRNFRNNVFHLREYIDFVRYFFDKELERLSWARELHTALAKFFSEYRISCEVHYLINGRKGECDLIKH